MARIFFFFFFFFNDTATTEIYTLSLHDALPISNTCGSTSADPTSWRPASQKRATNCSPTAVRSEEHTSELQSQSNLVCRLLLEKKKKRLATCVQTEHHASIHTSSAPRSTTKRLP